jgi:hypothetical protein
MVVCFARFYLILCVMYFNFKFMYPFFYFCSVLCVLFHCVVVWIVFLQMCNILLPPGVNTVAVNKYVVSYIVS